MIVGQIWFVWNFSEGRKSLWYIYSNSSERKAKGRYGFVRFTSVQDARRCVKLFHGAIVRGSRLIVTKARPKRQTQQGSQRQQRVQSDQDCTTPRKRLEWRPKMKEKTQGGRIAIFNDESQATGFSITGEINMEMRNGYAGVLFAQQWNLVI